MDKLIKDMDRSILCLALELPEPIYKDVAKKWKALKTELEKSKKKSD